MTNILDIQNNKDQTFTDQILMNDIFYQYFLKNDESNSNCLYEDMGSGLPYLQYSYKYIITNKNVILLEKCNFRKQIKFKAKLFKVYLKCMFTNDDCFCSISQFRMHINNKAKINSLLQTCDYYNRSCNNIYCKNLCLDLVARYYYELLYNLSDVISIFTNNIISKYFRTLIINILRIKYPKISLNIINNILKFLDFNENLIEKILDKSIYRCENTVKYLIYYYKLILKYEYKCKKYLNYLNNNTSVIILYPPRMPLQYIYKVPNIL